MWIITIILTNEIRLGVYACKYFKVARWAIESKGPCIAYALLYLVVGNWKPGLSIFDYFSSINFPMILTAHVG